MTPASRSLFDSYLIVDWSAASTPKRGKDSIWWALHRREEGLVARGNPTTRAEARAIILHLLAAEADTGRRVLAGFDFPFGYARGTAETLTGEAGWRRVWARLSQEIEDGPDNRNNRFDAAAAFNAAWPGDGPFWANGLKRDIDGLPRKRPAGYGETLPAIWRRTEEAAKQGAGGGATQECWKLAGAGSVGSQVLTGLPMLESLRRDPRLVDRVQVWPFETGLEPPTAAVTLAEVYPSLVPAAPDDGEVKDAAQVRATAARFAEIDEAGRMPALLSGPENLTETDKSAICGEEAWILGVGYEALMRDGVPAEERAAVQEPPGEEIEAGAEPVPEDAPMPPPAPPLHFVSPRTLDYIRDPKEIYEESFRTVRAESDLRELPSDVRKVAIRLVHACGIPAIAPELRWSDDIYAAAITALEAGAPVFCDCEMVAAGVIRRLLPARNEVLTTIGDERTPALATAIGNTRSAAAVELWRDKVEGAIVAIGNAPTALFHLLELIDDGWPKPAAILAFPVGFVGAAESKAALIRDARGVPFLTLRGRRGGSAMASAAVNALALEAEGL